MVSLRWWNVGASMESSLVTKGCGRNEACTHISRVATPTRTMGVSRADAKPPDSHPPEMAGSMRELSGDRRRQLIRSGTTVTSREREVAEVGSVIKKRRKRMAKKKHRKLLKRTRIQRRRAGK